MTATILLTTTVALLAISLVDGPFPRDQAWQHLPTLVGLVTVAVAVRKRRLGRAAIFCLCVFMWTHILGARYVYTFVPYDAWCERLTGISVSDEFGWQRNHYDRWAHVVFGAMTTWPVVEACERWLRLPRRWALVASSLVVAAVSALYEIFEWLLTLVASPAQAERYNGQQGDFWDAQKDMAGALFGCLVAVTVILVTRPRCLPPSRRLPERMSPSRGQNES